jgi:aminoglycoside phosphotransferase family enzyme
MNEVDVRNVARSGYYFKYPIHGHIEETHISWVILTKKYAFKIKKPLKLSFLDFSTLRKRKTFCSKELRLNQRFSSIYLNVSPVRKADNHWKIGGRSGKIVDYAVVMRRLNLTKRMDKMLAEKKVSGDHILALAKLIAAFHSKAVVVKPQFKMSKVRGEFNDIKSVSGLSAKHLGKPYGAIVKYSMDWSDAFLRAHAGHIRKRIEEGCYRDVHGDLHSGNIFLYKNPVLFDCIEFNDAYRQIDMINEIAFFCMDLEAYNQRRLARSFLREYQRITRCFQSEDDQELFNYYKCYRANVRAKVHALSAVQAHNVINYRYHLAAWRKYLQLMKKYTA